MGLPAYFSLMPDNVPLHQRGMASGFSPNCLHTLQPFLLARAD